MKVFKAKIVGGKIEVPPGTAEEGADVTVLVPEWESTFTKNELRSTASSTISS